MMNINTNGMTRLVVKPMSAYKKNYDERGHEAFYESTGDVTYGRNRVVDAINESFDNNDWWRD